MEIISIKELCKSDYNLRFFNFLEHFWNENRTFSCINRPKTTDLLIYLNNCDAVYLEKSGNKIYAKSGDMVYTPEGSEYSLEFINVKSQESSTLQINFFAFNESGERIRLCKNNVKVFSHENSFAIKDAFEKLKLLSLDASTLPTQNKSALFDILNIIGNENLKGKNDSLIYEGIKYLHSHYFESPSVSYLAKLCHISEEYFRRIFKAKTGLSPIEYKNRLRLNKAKEYLKFSDLSVQEISDNLGYLTVSHFIKQFKASFNCSPLKFKLSQFSQK